MSNISKVKINGTAYDIHDNNALPKDSTAKRAAAVRSALTSKGTTASNVAGTTYGVAAVTSSPYTYAKWYVNLDDGVTALTDGMIISIRVPVVGHSRGVCITLDKGTSFHPVVYSNKNIITTQFGVDTIVTLVYDSKGTGSVYNNSATAADITGVWRMLNMYYSDSNTYTQAYCNTSAEKAAKTASCTGYALLNNSYIMVNVVYSNTSASKLTLSINGKTAAPIYINGNVSSSTNYTLPAGSYLVFYNGTNYYFRTDDKITGNITGNAANVTGTVDIANGGTGGTTASAAKTNLGLDKVGNFKAVSTVANQSLTDTEKLNARNNIEATKIDDSGESTTSTWSSSKIKSTYGLGLGIPTYIGTSVPSEETGPCLLIRLLS